MDILPTCLELTHSAYPSDLKGKKIPPAAGKSLIPLIFNEITATHDTLFWEHEGGRAIRIGNWKMASLKGEEWELFDLSSDRTEVNNLADQYPGKVMEMDRLWQEWYRALLSTGI